MAHDQDKADHGSGKRTEKDREKRESPSKQSADPEHHLDVSETHRIDASEFFPYRADQPQGTTPDQSPEDRTKKGNQPRRLTCEICRREEGRVAEIIRHENKRKDYANCESDHATHCRIFDCTGCRRRLVPRMRRVRNGFCF